MIYTYMMRTHSQELTTTGRIGLGWVDVFKKVYQHFFSVYTMHIYSFFQNKNFSGRRREKKS